MADLIVVMGEGRVRQAGSPLDIYRRPSDAFVAAFIGSTNLIPASATAAAARPFPAARSRASRLPPATRDRFRSGRRTSGWSTRPTASIRGRVTFVRDLGATRRDLRRRAATSEIVAVSAPRDRPDVHAGAEVGVLIEPEDCVVLKP